MFKLFNRTSNLVKKLSCKWHNSPDDSTKLNISEKLEGQPFAKCVSYSFDHYQIPDKKQFKGGRVCPQGGRHSFVVEMAWWQKVQEGKTWCKEGKAWLQEWEAWE